MEQPALPRVVYRIVKHDPPQLDDYLPGPLVGMIREGTSAIDPRVFTGLSVFATVRQAAALSRRQPRLGSFIAEIKLPDGALVERTFGTRGHHTVWASPEALREAVQRVVPVR